MVAQKEKVVQSLIEGLNEVADLIEKANNLAQDYKTKFQATGVSLSQTNLTQAQVNAITSWIADLNTLATDPVVVSARSKRQPSHGVKSLG